MRQQQPAELDLARADNVVLPETAKTEPGKARRRVHEEVLHDVHHAIRLHAFLVVGRRLDLGRGNMARDEEWFVERGQRCKTLNQPGVNLGQMFLHLLLDLRLDPYTLVDQETAIAQVVQVQASGSAIERIL